MVILLTSFASSLCYALNSKRISSRASATLDSEEPLLLLIDFLLMPSADAFSARFVIDRTASFLAMLTVLPCLAVFDFLNDLRDLLDFDAEDLLESLLLLLELELDFLLESSSEDLDLDLFFFFFFFLSFF